MRVSVTKTCGLLVVLAGSFAACSEDPMAPDVAGQYFEAVSLDGQELPAVVARHSGRNGVLCEESIGGAVLVFSDATNYQLPISSLVHCGDEFHRSSVESRGHYTIDGATITFDPTMSATTVPVAAEVDGNQITLTVRRHDGEELVMEFIPRD